MCFRPATVSASVLCPVCGKKINEVMGNIPNICPFCEADLSEAIAAMKNASISGPAAAPTTPAAPTAPKAPSAPVTPSDNSKDTL